MRRDHGSSLGRSTLVVIAVTIVAAAAAVGGRAVGTAVAGGTAVVAGDPVAGKSVFRSSGCGGCHTLSATGAKGRVGPNLDQVKPTTAEVAAIVRRGSGAMPSFSGRLRAKAIADVAAFVAKATGGSARGGKRPSTGPALFQRYCGGCHTLRAANTTGTRGPNLDREEPDYEDVLEAALEGEDEMPSFRGRLTRIEIAKIAAFVSQSTREHDEDDDD